MLILSESSTLLGDARKLTAGGRLMWDGFLNGGNRGTVMLGVSWLLMRECILQLYFDTI